MKRFLILFAFFSFFWQISAEAAPQVITDYKIEHPGSQQGEGERGLVTLPEVYQDDHEFITDTSCYGLTFRLVSNGIVVFETIISSVNGGLVIVPDYYVGNFELQIQCDDIIFYGFVSL